VRSDTADSSREKVRMKGGQSREVGSRGKGWKNDEWRGQGWGFGRAEIFADEVEVAEGGG
jgi:hypothetical protein